jgi:hypothetical protein
MNIISATPETPGMTKEEVDMFLEKKFMLHIYQHSMRRVNPMSNQSGFTMIRVEKNS